MVRREGGREGGREGSLDCLLVGRATLNERGGLPDYFSAKM